MKAFYHQKQKTFPESSTFYESNIFLPLQTGIAPLHVLSALHCLDDEPIKLNPASHLKTMTLGKLVSLPNEEPFAGGDKGPQSTAETHREYDENEDISAIGQTLTARCLPIIMIKPLNATVPPQIDLNS